MQCVAAVKGCNQAMDVFIVDATRSIVSAGGARPCLFGGGCPCEADRLIAKRPASTATTRPRVQRICGGCSPVAPGGAAAASIPRSLHVQKASLGASLPTPAEANMCTNCAMQLHRPSALATENERLAQNKCLSALAAQHGT